MIRQPTLDADLYAWHRDAMAGLAPEIHDGMPECGWFKRRIVKGGPWVPVEVAVQRDIDPDTGELVGPEVLIAICDGQTFPAASIWTHLKPITREEHDALIQRHRDLPVMQATHAKLDLTIEPMRP